MIPPNILEFYIPTTRKYYFQFFFSATGLEQVIQMKIKYWWEIVQDHSNITIWFYHIKCNFTTYSNVWLTSDVSFKFFCMCTTLFKNCKILDCKDHISYMKDM